MIHEEAVKALSYDFTTILKGVHSDLAKKYEDTVKAIIADTELNGLDFPLICQPCTLENLSKYLKPEIAEKLKLEDFENQIDDKQGQEEEEKQSSSGPQGQQKPETDSLKEQFDKIGLND